MLPGWRRRAASATRWVPASSVLCSAMDEGSALLATPCDISVARCSASDCAMALARAPQRDAGVEAGVEAGAISFSTSQARRSSAAAPALGTRTITASTAPSCASSPLACLPKSSCDAAATPTSSPCKGLRLRYASRTCDLLQVDSSSRARTICDTLPPHTAAAGGAREFSVQQARQLHRQGRRAARALVPRGGPGAGSQCLPVHTAVVEAAAGFTEHQRLAQRGGNVGQRQPGAPAHGQVDAQVLQRHATAVEQRNVGWGMGCAHGVECGRGQGGQ